MGGSNSYRKKKVKKIEFIFRLMRWGNQNLIDRIRAKSMKVTEGRRKTAAFEKETNAVVADYHWDFEVRASLDVRSALGGGGGVEMTRRGKLVGQT